MSGAQTKRKIYSEDLVNIVWLCLLALAIIVYRFYNPSLLSELVGIIEDAISGGSVLFSGTTVNFALLFILFSAFRFLILMIVGVVKKQVSKVVGNLTFCFILAAIAYLFYSWLHVSLSSYYVLSVLLFLFGLYEVAKGISNGLFKENQKNILNGDWKTVLFGARIMILAALFTERNFLVFRDFMVFMSGVIGTPLMEGEFIIEFGAFIVIVLFVYVLTEFPSRLVFAKCKKCDMVFLKIGVSESSWDSEHTSRHRHCPRCSAACF